MLVLHPGWLTCPVDILGLYQQLHRGDLDAPLPILPSLQRIHQPITTRQLTALTRDELASVVAPSLATLHYCSTFSQDPTRQTGRNFASMAVDATCMGIVLSEAMPGAFLQCLSLNLLDHTVKEHNPGLAKIIVRASPYASKALLWPLWQVLHSSCLSSCVSLLQTCWCLLAWRRCSSTSCSGGSQNKQQGMNREGKCPSRDHA